MANFDELFELEIPNDLEGIQNNICLITKKKEKNKFFKDFADKTQGDELMKRWGDNMPVEADFTESGSGMFINPKTVVTAFHIYNTAKDPSGQVSIYLGNNAYKAKLKKQLGDYCELTVVGNNFPKNKSLGEVSVAEKKGVLKDLFKKESKVELYSMGYPYCVKDVRVASGTNISTGTSKTGDGRSYDAPIPAVVGSSGSPVFLHVPELGMLLVGVVAGGEEFEINVFDQDPVPTAQIFLRDMW